MVKGLVRKNNLSDLPDPILARTNLGLATADYEKIRGLYASAFVSNTDVQKIAGSRGNYQQQIDSLNSTLSGIVSSLYVSRSGDTITSGWTNYGLIQAGSYVQSGSTLTASTDALFTLTVSGLSFNLSTSALVMNSGVTVQKLSSNGNTAFTSGVTTVRLVPIRINGVPYFLEAS